MIAGLVLDAYLMLRQHRKESLRWAPLDFNQDWRLGSAIISNRCLTRYICSRVWIPPLLGIANVAEWFKARYELYGPPLHTKICRHRGFPETLSEGVWVSEIVWLLDKIVIVIPQTYKNCGNDCVLVESNRGELADHRQPSVVSVLS